MVIVVCVKQVPIANNLKIDPKSKNLVRDNAEGVMNPFDRHAVEAALSLKEQVGGKIIAISMGPEPFTDTLREAVALGCDEAFLLSSRAFAGADTLATAYVLAKAVEKLNPVDLVLLGRHAVDADTGQVGPLVAEFLNLPHVTLAQKLTLLSDQQMQVERLADNYVETVMVKLPAIITATSELNIPRYASPLRIMDAADMDIIVWDENYLQCDANRIGVNGSPTVVTEVYMPPKPESNAQLLAVDPDTAGREIAAILKTII